MKHSIISQTLWRRLLLVAGLALATSTTPAAELPGEGITVTPAKSTIAEETFQTLLVMKGLEELGYSVRPIQEIDYPAAHIAVGNGDATFLADHWYPSHEDFYIAGGGEAKLWRAKDFSAGAVQGYLIDKKTADAHHISNVEQMRDPEIARLFDTDGDGKADLTGCPPGWGCEQDIEHHMDAYELRDTVTHVQGNYSALIADTIARYKKGEPIFYYTWTPFWVSNVLVPGRDVSWLEVPFSALPGAEKDLDTALPNGKNYGWSVNNQCIVANRAFIEDNPAARSFMSEIRVPVADINAQNRAMQEGAKTPDDIERHAEAWIEAHQEQWDAWIAQALAAAR